MDQIASKALFRKCDDVAAVLGSLSHPTRLKVLCSLALGPKTVGELTSICEISQPAMSQFLSRMKDDGMIESERDGQRIYYSLKDKKITKLLESIKGIYCG